MQRGVRYEGQSFVDGVHGVRLQLDEIFGSDKKRFVHTRIATVTTPNFPQLILIDICDFSLHGNVVGANNIALFRSFHLMLVHV